MPRKLSLAVATTILAATAVTAATFELQPIPDAFMRLGHSCGGITQQIFGQGFDANGNVTGFVFVITRCGGSGRGGGYHSTAYSTWVAVTWNSAGKVIEESTRVPQPDPSIAGVMHSGGKIGGANYPTCNNITAYDNAFTCFSVPVQEPNAPYSVQTELHVVNQAACTASNTTYCTYRAVVTTP